MTTLYDTTTDTSTEMLEFSIFLWNTAVVATSQLSSNKRRSRTDPYPKILSGIIFYKFYKRCTIVTTQTATVDHRVGPRLMVGPLTRMGAPGELKFCTAISNQTTVRPHIQPKLSFL